MNEFGVRMFLMESIMVNLLECFIIYIWTVWGWDINILMLLNVLLRLGRIRTNYRSGFYGILDQAVNRYKWTDWLIVGYKIRSIIWVVVDRPVGETVAG